MFDYRNGDILFQDLGCGSVCAAIDKVTPGYRNAEINHCAIVLVRDGEVAVVEAIAPKVSVISLQHFVSRNPDQFGRPRVMVGRCTMNIEPLIPLAVKFCAGQVGLPYDKLYLADDQALYCSELIVDAFRAANGGQYVFPEEPMSFRGPSGDILKFWKDYYDYFGVPVPDGKLGSNPGKLSLSPYIEIVHQLGDLRGAPLESGLVPHG